MTEWIISSSFLILVVLTLRATLGQKISAGLRYALWGVVLLRLLVPVSLLSLRVAPVLPAWTPPTALLEESIYFLPVGSAPLENTGVRVLEDGTLVDANSFGYPRLTDGGERVVRYAEKISPLELLEWIWLAGAVAMGVVLAASNGRFYRRLRRIRKPLENTHTPIPVYAAEGLPSPCLVGALRPAVYVTPEAAEDPVMLRHVLAHELTHYEHRDHLWSVLRGAALAVHWWNPLVWLAVVCSRRDGELACDDGALRRLGNGERAAYGETLLALVTAKGRPGDLLHFATTMTGGKGHLTERIRRIAHRPKVLASAVVAVAVVLTFATLTAFGQAQAAPEVDGEDDIGEPLPVETWDRDHPDLDHDGVPDTLEIREIEDAGGIQWLLEFTPSNKTAPVWDGEALTPHVGWTSFYLYRVDGEDYLLQYTPYMSGGGCYYSYKLFYLTSTGGEVVVQENEVEFDLIFAPEYADQHHFDPEAIAAFMEEINGLLEKSELLINTDENLLGTFQQEGRLYDSLWWLDDDRDDSKSVVENLENYAGYADDHPDDTWSSLADLLLNLTEENIMTFSGDTSELVRLLRAAERGSRFYTWNSYTDAYLGAGAEEVDYTIWNLPLADGSALWLLVCEERPSVLMIYETTEEVVSAFYTMPELKELILHND